MNFGEDLELDADNDVVGADTGRVVAKFSHHAEAESFVKFYNNQKKQIAEITSLRAELEKAKKDGERYRAIRKSGNNMRVVFGKYPDGINIHATENHLCDTALDEVIDNAMKGNS